MQLDCTWEVQCTWMYSVVEVGGRIVNGREFSAAQGKKRRTRIGITQDAPKIR